VTPTPSAHSAIEYLPFPLIIWASMRFGVRGASAASLVLTASAVWHYSISPLERHQLGADADLLLLQTSIAVIVPVMIFLFVWAMKAFDTIFVLTSGGPRGGTTTLNYLVYQQGFEQFRFGRAAATAYVLTLLTLLVIAGLTLVRRRLHLVRGT
jgi:hypothetical protein